MYTITRPCEICGKDIRFLSEDIESANDFVTQNIYEHMVGLNDVDDYIEIFACDVCTHRTNKEFNVLEYVLDEYLNIIENAIMWKYNIEKAVAHDIMSRNKSYKKISEQINIFLKAKDNE